MSYPIPDISAMRATTAEAIGPTVEKFCEVLAVEVQRAAYLGKAKVTYACYANDVIKITLPAVQEVGKRYADQGYAVVISTSGGLSLTVDWSGQEAGMQVEI